MAFANISRTLQEELDVIHNMHGARRQFVLKDLICEMVLKVIPDAYHQ